jgi:uncharacterized protein
MSEQEKRAPRGIAPVWHTVVIILFLVALGWSGSHRSQKETAIAGHTAVYVVTIVYQWLLVAFIAFGVRLRGLRIRDLVGGRWNSFEAVLTDFAIGIGAWFTIIVGAGVLVYVMKLQTQLTHSEQNLMKKIAPQTGHELAWFIALALTAGFCEEVIFRGYLQKQIKAWTSSSAAAVVLSTLIFGFGHLYQGWMLAIAPTILGLILALMAEWRKSLRPGIILHTWQDSLAGIAQHFASKMVR